MSYQAKIDNSLAEGLAIRKEMGALRRDPAEDPERYFQLAPQQAFVQAFLNPHTPWRSVHLQHACHSPETLVLLDDGRQIPAAAVRVGEYLMGESGPARVTQVHIGEELMYEIVAEDGRIFSCNASHIICAITNVPGEPEYTRWDLTLRQYLEKRVTQPERRWWLFSMAADYEEKEARLSAEYIGSHLAELTKIPIENILTSLREREKLLEAIFKDRLGITVLDVEPGFPREYLVDGGMFTEGVIAGIQRLCWSTGVSAARRLDGDLMIVWRDFAKAPGGKFTPRCSHRTTFLEFEVNPLGLGKYCGFTLEGDNPRFLLANYIVTHNTGVGKTIGGIAPATVFMQIYQTLYSREVSTHVRGKKMYQEIDAKLPNVFIFGFDSTKRAFLRDILRYPKFGFVNSAELEELAARQRLAASGVPGAEESAREYYLALKRRVFKKAHGGFLRFYGYDEFVNRLFSTSLKLSDIDAEAIAEGANTEELIADYIREGKITLNQAVLASFKDSIIIADEIHNTYNSISKNSRGVALKYLLDMVPTLRLITLSATPANNSPAEFVELIDFHVEPSRRVPRKELFSGRILAPGAEEKLRGLMRGWISYFRDDNPELYPTHELVGEELVTSSGKVAYLRFQQIPMSEYHQRSLEHHTKTREAISADKPDHYIVSSDSYSLFDIVFPNPMADAGSVTAPGLYHSSDIKNKLASAPDDWKQKIGLTTSVQNGIFTVGGTWLRQENLAKYSAKHARLVEFLIAGMTIAQGDPGNTAKSLIYHNMIVGGGVVLVQEILRENGFISLDGAATDFTLCLACGQRQVAHTYGGWYRAGDGNGVADHMFIPARFAVVHSEIGRAEMTALMDDYNLPANYLGHQCAIMVGAKIIAESYEFKDVRALYLLSVPLDISMEIQIFGRVIRNNSHGNLPAGKRNVKIYLLIHVMNPQLEHSFADSPEVHKYADKMADFLVIQRIEKIMNEVAVDGFIHRNTIMNRAALKEFFPSCPECWASPWGCSCEPAALLRGLYYEPERAPGSSLDHSAPPSPASLERSSWLAYGGNFQEIEIVSFVLKRLFAEQSVWTYSELLAASRQAKYRIPINPATIDEDSFIIALRNLVDVATPVEVYSAASKAIITKPVLSLEEMFTDYRYRGIPSRFGECTVVRSAEYYIMIPVGQRLDADVFTRTHSPAAELSCDIHKYLLANPPQNIASWLAIWKARSAKPNSALGFLLDTPVHFQEYVVREIIEGRGEGVAGSSIIVEILLGLGALVRGKEVRRYKGVAAQFSSAEEIQEGALVGYTRGKSIHLRDPALGSWFTIARTALNRQPTGKESPHVVGVFAEQGDAVLFKLRAPLGKSGRRLESARGTTRSSVDFRTIERGIVCSTKTKESLRGVAQMLGLDMASLAGQKVPAICTTLALAILSSELAEQRGNGLVKYLYGWWDDIPAMTSKTNKKLNKRRK